MKQIIKAIIKAVKYSEKSRQEGLLSLEKDINEDKSNRFDIFKFGLKLAIDGANPEYINNVLTNMIELEQDKKNRLTKIIQRETVLCIQAGYNPKMLAFILLSFVDKNTQTVLEKILSEDDLDLEDIDKMDDFDNIEITTDNEMNQDDFIYETANIIIRAYNFSMLSRREGLLALESELAEIDNELLKKGMRLVVDGTDSKIIYNFLTNKIDPELNEKTRRLIKIIREAVLSIQAGDNSEILMHKMLSYMNNPELKALNDIITGVELLSKFNFEEDAPASAAKLPAQKDTNNFIKQIAYIIHRAYKFSIKAMKNGLLDLKDDIDNKKYLSRDIFDYGMQFAVDGTENEIINSILTNLIESEQDEEIRRLKQIQKEAVIGIQKGENPKVLFHVLISYINNIELEGLQKLISNTAFSASFKELLENPPCCRETMEEMQKNYINDIENNCGSHEVIEFFSQPRDLLSSIDPDFFMNLKKQEDPRTVLFLLACFYSGINSAGGIETIADIIKHADHTTKNNIMEKLENNDPELANVIKQYLVTFDDILFLDDEAVKKVLLDTDSYDLATALNGADIKIKDKIFGNLPENVISMIKEDMEYLGSVKTEEIEKAQQKMASIIMFLQNNGEITIKR